MILRVISVSTTTDINLRKINKCRPLIIVTQKIKSLVILSLQSKKLRLTNLFNLGQINSPR